MLLVSGTPSGQLRRHESWSAALDLAVAIGFAVLRFSEFVPFSTFGSMVAIATAGSTLGNLVLLPACLTLAERYRH